MKNRFTRIAVLLLCLSMVLTSQTGFFAYAAEESAAHEAGSTAGEEPKGETSPEKGKESNQKDAATPAPEKPQPVTSLRADNADKKDKDAPAVSITIENKDGFPGDSQAEVALIEKESDISALTSAIQKETKTKSDLKSLLAMEVSINQGKEEIETGTTSKVTLTATGAEDLSDSVLYHQKKDGSFEEVKFDHKAKKDVQTIEFETSSFSPFIFVSEIEQGSPEEVNADTSSDDTTENTSATDDEQNNSSTLRGPLKAPTRGASKTIEVNAVDSKGDALSSLNAPFDLYFYEFPQSVLASGESVPSDSNMQIAISSALRSQSLEAYKSSVPVNSPTESLTLTMEDAATAENPYILYFSGNDIMDAMMSGGTANEGAEVWSSGAILRYDGTDIEVIPVSNSIVSPEVDGNTCSVPVAYLGPMTRMKLKYSVDTAAYRAEASDDDPSPFPFTFGSAGIPLESTSPITEDGTGDIRTSVFVPRVLYEGWTPPTLSIRIIDSPASSDATWRLSANGTVATNSYITIYAAGMDEDGYLTGSDGTPIVANCTLGFSNPKVTATVHIDSNGAELSAEDCPFYLKSTLYLDNNTYEKETEITAADVDKDVTVTFNKRASSSQSKYASFDIYTDAECTQHSDKWMVSYTGDLTADIKYDSIPLKFNAEIADTEVTTFPLWLKAVYHDSAMDKTIVLPFNEAGTKELDFGTSSTSAFWSNNGGPDIYFSIYSDEECTQPAPLWDKVDEQHHLYYNSNQNIFIDSNTYNPTDTFTFALTASKTVSIPASFNSEGMDSEYLQQFFPVYMKATLSSLSGAFEDKEVVKQLTSPADMTDVVFTADDDQYFDASDQYSLTCSFYTDADCTQKSPLYEEKTYDYAIMAGIGFLMDANQYPPSRINLNVSPVSVKVAPQPYTDSELPAKISLTYNTQAGSETEYADRDSFDEFTQGLSYVAFIGSELSVSANVMKTDDPETPRDKWMADSTYASIGADGLLDDSVKPYEGTATPVSVSIPIHVNKPDGVSPIYAPQSNYYYSEGVGHFHVVMFRKNLDGDFEAVSTTGYNTDSIYNIGFGTPLNGYSCCYTRDSELDTDNKGSVSVGMHQPGKYYLCWCVTPYQTEYLSSSSKDRYWQEETSFVEINVDEEGNVTDASGNPFTAEFLFNELYLRTKVVPQIDVETTLPDDYSYTNACGSSSLSTPSSVTISFSGAEDSNSHINKTEYIAFRQGSNRSDSNSSSSYKYQMIPNGHSLIGMQNDYFNWAYYVAQHRATDASYSDGYEGTPVISSWHPSLGTATSTRSVSFYNLYVYRYNDDSLIEGYPVGDYNLSYSVRSGWYSDSVKVHLAEDGKIYKINDDGSVDTEPYVIELRQATDEELKGEGTEETVSFKVKIHSYTHEGVNATDYLTDSSTINLSLIEDVLTSSGYVSRLVATATVPMSDAGLSEAEFTTVSGEPMVFYENAAYTVTGTVLEEEDSNPAWLVTSRYDITGIENGYLVANDAEVTLDNECLKLPWKTTSPGTITQAESDATITFKLLPDTSQVTDKANYIILAYNRVTESWYALSTDENGGWSVKLADISVTPEEIDDTFEYKIPEDSDLGSYVFQANKTKQAEGSVQLQLKSGVKNSSGKTLSVKMGQSSTVLEPLIDGSAGTVTLKQAGEKTFELWKGTYSRMEYVEELFGFTGFDIQGYHSKSSTPVSFTVADTNAYPGFTPVYKYFTEDDKPYYGATSYPNSSYGNSPAGALMLRPGLYQSGYYSYDFDYMSELGTNYYSDLANRYNTSQPVTTEFYVLTDTITEEVQTATNDYTLVKTVGDFNQTFMGVNDVADMVFVWTDTDGKEYALNPNGLSAVRSEPSGNGYRKVKAGADCELIPNNNSGTSARFAFNLTDVLGSNELVITSDYAFRKSRQNSNAEVDYMTMNGSVWTKNDDGTHGDGTVYVLNPVSPYRGDMDADVPTAYTLSVIRYGKTYYLGIDENKNQVLVTSKDDAAVLNIYTDKLYRYYSSAQGSDLYRYYKINNLEDINSGDELLIVYNDGTQRYVLQGNYLDTGFMNDSYMGDYGNRNMSLPRALYVLDGYSTIDKRDTEFPENAGYMYRSDYEEYTMKPYAYLDPEDESVIWAQGVVTNATGTAKSETNKQRKYESVFSIANNYILYIKAETLGMGGLFTNKTTAETSFLPGDEPGTFYIRGGKSTHWIGTSEYAKQQISLGDGSYSYSAARPTFTTVETEDRVPFEIYKRSTVTDTFTVEYYDETGTTLDKKETKPQDTFVLTQKQDMKHGDTDYIFVGWTTDPEKAGFLSLADSANLYDYDDIAKKGEVKQASRDALGLLGNCSPENQNYIEYSSIEDKVVEGVLKVYPVYAIKGYSSAVSANEENRMIIGASDFKDMQMSGDGTHSTSERWLGSINIEVYKDGELWVPGSGGSTIGKKKARGGSTSATLYFAYHNDNAADLNIKFIADGITAETLYGYMSSGDFNTQEPSENYRIDAVWAEQGGSEDGLKYRYNWMSSDVGGQLDNVKGGSTVKIYVTTKYQVKYYFDDGSDSGYQQLTDDPWTDDGLYVTPGTRLAIEEMQNEHTSYLVKAGNDYDKLISRTPSLTTTFKDENISRGAYSEFLYEFEEYDEAFDVARLPDPPAGKTLKSNKWAIKNSHMNDVHSTDPESVWQMQGTSYGTGNTIYAYKGASDQENTYHLYAEVEQPLPVPTGVGKTSYAALILMAVAGILLAVNKKRRAAEKQY